jgi:putative tricarboxylic transport membrane protein
MSRSEKISSVILILFGLFVAYYSLTYLKLGILIRPGAGFIPFYIGVALTVLGLVWFFHALLTRKLPSSNEAGCADVPTAVEPVRNIILFRLLPAVLFTILYAWLFEKIGYFVSTLLFMVGWQKVVEKEGWLKTAVIAVLCAGAMYGLFAYLLKIALPTGLWFT